ncbi:MAG: glycosyl transferase [Snowella sp.]|nr:glycosyl transferase [Snowella sp.]
MSQPIIYLAATGHGFGHAVRVASVAATLKKCCPESVLILTTTAPRWLLESYIEGDFIHRSRAFDVGVIQADSLRMDKEATLKELQDIYARQRSLIVSEANFLRTNRVGVVLADIPPLMAAIAQEAEIPCYMMSNFGWDFIYQDWGADFQDIVEQMQRDYQRSDRLFRFPLSEPMTAFPHITDVGLTGGNPRFAEQELRQQFGINQPTEKTVLLTFGGLGLQAIPYGNLEQFPDWQFITFDPNAPNADNLVKITDKTYRPVDFMPLCGRVFSKPGFSTFAEAMRLEIPVMSLTRDDFSEATVLLDGLQDYSYHQIIRPEEFFTDNWNFFHQPLTPPRKAEKLDKNGGETIAQEVLKLF